MQVRHALACLAVAALAVAGCGSGGTTSGGSGSADRGPLTLLFGSSSPAETAAVSDAAAAYTKRTGVKVAVTPSQNQVQQLAQGFAANRPPDVFYLDPGVFQNYAKRSELDAYAGRRSDANDFYPTLRQTFTYKSTFYCVPKDWGTLALIVRNDDWAQAGLTGKDVPTTWDQLEQVARKLTTGGRTGLSVEASHSGIDEFFYQNGGAILGSGGTKAVVDSSRNVQALTFLKRLMSEGVLKYPAQLDSRWTGDALGENKAAMAITGPWLTGSMSADYPGVGYTVYPLPAGPGGHKGTLSFSNCWGIPAHGAHTAAAEKFVSFLATSTEELALARAFGPIPPRKSARDRWARDFPAYLPFAETADAHPDIALAGDEEALADFDSKLAQLPTSDPKALLSGVQTNLQAVIDQHQ